MELTVKTNLEKDIIQSIDWNFEELEAQVTAGLEKYQDRVVTTESLKDDKKDMTQLRNLKTAIEDKRKDVKKACLKPYEDFEAKVKPITQKIDACISNIDQQAKDFEAAEKAEKRKEIEHFFKMNIRELMDILPLDLFWEEKWLNKGETLPSVTKALEAKITKARNDINILKAMKLECEDVMLNEYYKTLDMGAALAEKTKYEARKEALRQAEKAKNAPSIDIPVQQPVQPADVPFGDVPAPAEETKTIKVIFHDTTSAFRLDMKALTIKHGIKYGGA